MHGPLVPANGLVMRERGIGPTSDPAKWATGDDGWQGFRDQFCTDFGGSVAALVDGAGVVEQYRYSNSGVPHGIPLGDLNGDGVVDATTVDYNIWLNAKTTYEVRADLDFDGDVDSNDGAIITANNGNASGRGRLSIATIREIYGWQQREVFAVGLHTLWLSNASELDSGLQEYLGGMDSDANPGPSQPRPNPTTPSPTNTPCDPTDPNQVCKCTTDTGMGISFLHHTYLWWPGDKLHPYGCGMYASCGGRITTTPPERHGGEGGPRPDGTLPTGVLYCYKVYGESGAQLSPSQMQAIRDCICSPKIQDGIWFPGFNDCHNAVNGCIQRNGGVVPDGDRIF